MDCNVYANGPIIAPHAAEDGDITLETDCLGEIHDALIGERAGKGPCINLPMTKGDTRVLRVRGK